MPNAMRNSSLFKRMMRGSWVSETESLEAGAAPALALKATNAMREIVFIRNSDCIRTRNINRAAARRQMMKTSANPQFAHAWTTVSCCRLFVGFLGFGAFHRGLGLCRTALGCGRDFLSSFLALGGNAVRHFLRRHGNLFRTFLGRLRDHFGIVFDRLADHLGVMGYRCANIVGWIRVEGGRQQHTYGDQQCIKGIFHKLASCGQPNRSPYFWRRTAFCTLPVPPKGSDSRNTTSSGTLKRATCFDRKG